MDLQAYHRVPPMIRILCGVLGLFAVFAAPMLWFSKLPITVALAPLFAGLFALSIAVFGRSPPSR